MTTVTQIQCSPEQFSKMLLDDLLRQLSGTAANTIDPNEVAPQSAEQAAAFLGCSVAHLATIVRKHPDKLKPIVEQKKATRYHMAELLQIKRKGLVK